MKKSIFIATLFISQIIVAQNPLLIPDTIAGTTVNLNLQTGTHQFYSGINTNTTGANGSILAPTLLLNKGDLVNFHVKNLLPDTTTIHWHGMHVSPENDGGPHTLILPGATWSPSFTVMDKAATYWYHPHLHGKTNEHVTKGIAGVIIVRDSVERSLTLPRKYGVDDFPLVLQTKDFDAAKQILVHTNSDDVPMVNATIDPYLNVPAQVIRFRVLNGSSMRAFNIGLSNNQTFYQIASDGGLLSSPYSTTRLQLAPGERAEILVDFSGKNGQTIYLKSYASQIPNGVYGATNPGMNSMMTLNGYNPNPLNGADYNLLKFTVGAQNSSAVTTIPTSLTTVTRLSASTANITRTLTFRPLTMGRNQLNGKFSINNASFDMNVINYNVQLNNVEVWELVNRSAMAHPFHIHDVQFYILSRNGSLPPVNERGRKDVVLVNPMETVKFICKFEDFMSNTVPYMYHCHLLTHEDDGMMGQFKVLQFVGLDKNTSSGNFTIYPNPNSTGSFKIENKDNVKLTKIDIYNTLGKIVKTINPSSFTNEINIEYLSEGMYLVNFYSDKGLTTKKLIIK